MSLKQTLNFLFVTYVNLDLCWPDTEQKMYTGQSHTSFFPLVLILTSSASVVVSNLGRTCWLRVLIKRAGRLV